MSKPKLQLPVLLRRAPLVSLLLVLVAMSILAGLKLMPAKPASAATSSTLNFQARLLTSSGSLVPDGNYNVEFKIFDAASSSGSSQGSCSGDSNCLWTETRVTSDKVRVANGYLTVNLGSVTAFPSMNWDQELWLSMNIGGVGSPSWDGEMTPRLKLTAVPYAFRAGQLAKNSSGNLATLDFTTPTANRSILLPDASGTVCLQNASACGFALSSGSGNYIQNGTSTQTANFNIQSASAGSVAAVIQGAASQTADILQVTTSAGGYGLKVDASGRTFAGDTLYVGVTSAPGVTPNGRLTVVPGSVNTIGQVIRLANTLGSSSTNVDSFQIQDVAGVCAWRISNVASTGNASAGSCDNSSTSGGSYQSQFRTGDISSSGSGTSGVVILRSGNNSVGGNTGAVTIKSGDATTTGSGISGAVTIDTGSGLGGTSGITIGGTNASSITLGKTSSNVLTTINGRVLTKPVSDSSSAFQVQNASGVALLTADSSNSRVMLGNVTTTGGQELAGALYFADGTTDGFGLTLNTTTLTGNRSIALPNGSGTLCLQSSVSCGFLTGSASDYIQNTTSAQSANLYVQAASSGSVAGVFRANAAGAGDILDLLNGSGTTVATFSSTGAVLFKNSTNSATAFQVQPSGSTTPVLNVDTSNSRVGIGNAAPTVDLDVGPATLSASQIVQTRVGDFILQSQQGSSNGITASTSRGTNGNLTLDGASGSALYLSPFTTNNNFLASGGGSVRVGDQTVPGYKLDVAGDINSTTALRIAGTIVCDTSGTTGCTAKSGSGYYIHNQTTVQAANMYVQAATTGTVAAILQAFNGGSGDILDLLNGSGTTVATFGSTGAVLIKNSTNSTSAFQIQPSGSTTPVFNVDTTNSRVGIGTATPGSALDVVGGISQASGAVSLQANAASQFTTSAGALTLTSAASAFWTVGGTNQSLTVRTSGTGILTLDTAGAGTVTLGSSAATVNIGTTNNAHVVHIADGGSSNTQTVTMGSTNGSSSTTIQGGTGSGAIALTAGAGGSITATTTSTGAIALNTATSITAKTTTNSTTGFQVQNSSSVNQLTVDTSNARIYVGPTAGDTTGTILVLGNKTNSGDPTEVDGAIYYNSSSKSFRCGVNSGWRNCGGLMFANTSPSSTTVTNSNAMTNWTDTGYGMLANDCQPGVTYLIMATGIVTDTSGTTRNGRVALNLDGTTTTLATTPAKSFTSSDASPGLNWQFNAQIICDTTGASGTIEAQGMAHYPANAGSWLTNGATNTGTVTFDTTTSHTLYLGWKWDVADTGVSATLRQFIVQRIGPP